MDDDDEMIPNGLGNNHPVQWLAYIGDCREQWYGVSFDTWQNTPWLMSDLEDKDCGLRSSTLTALGITAAQLPVGNGGSNTLYRFKEGVERFMITDINNPGASALAQTEIPVQWN